jgi:hypothetical protein
VSGQEKEFREKTSKPAFDVARHRKSEIDILGGAK